MKQAIKITAKNCYAISRTINRDLTPQQLHSERGRWLVAEQIECTSTIPYSILDEATFHEEYQIQPFRPDVEDLHLDAWNRVVHRDTVAVEGVTFELTYLEGNNLHPSRRTFDTRDAAVKEWDRMNSTLDDYTPYRPQELTRIEVLRSQTDV